MPKSASLRENECLAAEERLFKERRRFSLNLLTNPLEYAVFA